MTPQLVVLAGPNGAGKSTFYDAFLADSPLPFLNADLFAAETGVDSLQAARILDATRAQMIEDKLGFITETVFSDPHGAKLEMLRAAREAGYSVTLIYIGVAGGHDVPRERLASRFERSLRNLAEAIPIVSSVQVYDNSSVKQPYRVVASFQDGALTSRMRGAIPRWARTIVPSRRRKR